MAGEVSKDLTRRMLLPQEIVGRTRPAIIHFHDADYFAQRQYGGQSISLTHLAPFVDVSRQKIQSRF